MKIFYTPHFLKLYKKLNIDLQNEVKEKIELFRQNSSHSFLTTHKLNGRLKDRFSFSINYKTRIVFKYLNENEVAFLVIGNHDVYKS